MAVAVASVVAIVGATVGVTGLGLTILSKKKDYAIGGIVNNRTRFGFHLRENTSSPAKGHWMNVPEAKIDSAAPILEREMQDGKSEQEAVATIVGNETLEESFLSYFILGGRTRQESLAVYDVDEKALGEQMSIACYLFSGPRGYWAGVSLSSHNWIGDKANGTGKKLIDHINNVHTDKCQLSDGAAKSARITVKGYTFEVTFQAGKEVVFEVNELEE